MLGHDLEHLGRREVRELAPPQVAVQAAAREVTVVPVGEDRVVDFVTEPRGLLLGKQLQVVQSLDEEQVGDLLDHLDRVGDAA